jgi:Predicted transcriptional regulators
MSSKSLFETNGTRSAVGPESPFDDPVEILLSMQEIVGRKWHPAILYDLHSAGPMGFGALKRSLNGVSSKVLSESLDRLQANGLVTREVVSDRPLRVEYSLTDRGESLACLLGELVRWGSEHTAALEGDQPAQSDDGRSQTAPEGKQ